MEGMRLMPKEKKRGVCMLLIAAMLVAMLGQSRVYVGAETTEDSTETTTYASYTYQAENFNYTYGDNGGYEYYDNEKSSYESTKDATTEGVFAVNMQPGESISYTLPSDFVSGSYVLSVYSCGTRVRFDISVTSSGSTEAKATGTVTRGNTGYGTEYMTLDVCATTLSLEAGDTITITGQSDKVTADNGEEVDYYYGWVDYIQLDQGAYVYQAEDTTSCTYSGGSDSSNIKDTRVELQTNESISFTLGSDFAGGTYALSVYSNGNRTSFDVKVGDTSVGTITRKGTGFEHSYKTLDTLMVIDLSASSTITITDLYSSSSGDSGSFGWVDYIRLDPVSDTSDYIVCNGGSLRMDYSEDYSKTCLRIGFDIYTPDNEEISSWYWDLSYGTYKATKTGENKAAKKNKTTGALETDTNGNTIWESNIVITGIPSTYYDTDFTAQLTVIYKRTDGSTLTVVGALGEKNTRSVKTVATNISTSTSSTVTESEKNYATGILNYIAPSSETDE